MSTSYPECESKEPSLYRLRGMDRDCNMLRDMVAQWSLILCFLYFEGLIQS